MFHVRFRFHFMRFEIWRRVHSFFKIGRTNVQWIQTEISCDNWTIIMTRFNGCCPSHSTSRVANRIFRSLALGPGGFSYCSSRFTVRVSFLPHSDLCSSSEMTSLPHGCIFYLRTDDSVFKSIWYYATSEGTLEQFREERSQFIEIWFNQAGRKRVWRTRWRTRPFCIFQDSTYYFI